MNKIEPRVLKGFRDYNLKEESARQSMFAKIKQVFETFGFAPLSTPVLEYKDVLMGKYGDEGEKLIYSFKDNGDRDVAMRYDLTVPLARYVAQNQNQLTLPFKRYQVAPVWRADNPQKGRLREFYQCDVDVVGATAPISDAEVVACTCKAIEAVGITDYEVRINDRALFEAVAESFVGENQAEALQVMRAIDKVNKIGSEGVMNLLKEENISAAGLEFAQMLLAAGKGNSALDAFAARLAEKKNDTVTQFIVTQFRTLLDLIIAQGIAADKIVFDPSTVRGLDYYTGLVYEVVLKDNPEFGSITGGGRYDGLLETFSDTPVPAVGGSIGIDRLFAAMESMNLVESSGMTQVLVMNLDEAMAADYVVLASELRSQGIPTEVYDRTAKLDKQFKYAESKDITWAILLGSDEKANGTVQLKNLKTREQEVVNRTELISKLQ